MQCLTAEVPRRGLLVITEAVVVVMVVIETVAAEEKEGLREIGSVVNVNVAWREGIEGMESAILSVSVKEVKGSVVSANEAWKETVDWSESVNETALQNGLNGLNG